jgi:hypothetical protein
MHKCTVLLLFLLAAGSSMSAQNTSCKFDQNTLQFTGTPAEQARCLLRPNLTGGNLGEELKKLPSPLEKSIGTPTVLSKVTVRKYLIKQGIVEDALGGSLDALLSVATLPNGEKIPALYFIIHDSSSPYLKDEPFPENFNTDKTDPHRTHSAAPPRSRRQKSRERSHRAKTRFYRSAVRAACLIVRLRKCQTRELDDPGLSLRNRRRDKGRSRRSPKF